MSELRISCPECQAQYRLKAEPKPNATLRCAKCGASFPWSGSASRPTTAKPQPRPAVAVQQAPPAAKTNWGLYASLGAVAALLVVCSVLATVIILQRREPAGLGPVAQAQAADPASAQAPAAAPPLATPETSEASSVKQAVAAPPAPAANAAAAEAAIEAPAPENADEAVVADASADPPEAEPIAEVAAAPAAPAAAEPAPPAVNLAGPPRYQWRKGDVLAYKFEIVADLGDEFDKVSGTCQLDVSPWDEPKPQPKVAVDLPEELEGPQYSGSAFVVHPDGYLATCAHVVNGAKTVTLNLNDHEYQAEVVALNQEDDLALLKVKARNLKWLPLADSDKVQLGEDVRVLGYPLTDLLGSNLKVSQGIISGVVMEGGSKRFQIDASVNPGNSGGPVVNGRGEVVGMAASMLASAELSKLAFAVPSGSIQKMLTAQKVAPANAAAAQAPVDGPALVSRASKSMALVHVTAGVDQPGEGELVAFRFVQTSQRSPKEANRLGFPHIPRGVPFSNGDGRMKFSERGELLSCEGEAQLPYTIGCLPALMVEPLDANGQNFWEEKGKTTISTVSGAMALHARRFPMPRSMPFPPGLGMEQTREAEYRHGYRVLERNKNLITIEKTYSLRTLDDEQSPYLSITGKGRLVFDQARGCVTSLDYKQTVKRNVGNANVNIPMRVTFSLQDAKDFVADKLPYAIAAAKTSLSTRRSKPGKAAQSPEEQVDALLRSIARQIASGENSIPEISTLGNVDVVPSRQAQVCKVLLQAAALDSYGSSSALRALEKWADESCVPALLKLLESNDHFTASQAAEILGMIGDERAAEPLAQALLREGFSGHQYKEALKKLGPKAESAVLPLLEDRDEDVRREACEVLGEIGTKRSLKALEAMIADRRGERFGSIETMTAEQAVEKIERRAAGHAALGEIAGLGDAAKLARLAGIDAQLPDFPVGPAGRMTSLKLAREVLADRSAGERERQRALQMLADTAPPDEATRQEIATLLNRSLTADEGHYARMLTLKALAKWGGPEHEDQLLKMLKDPGNGSLVEIYEALGQVGGERSARVLLEELKNHQRNSRLAPAIAEALGASSEPGPTQDAIFELLKSNDVLVRAMAAKAIGKMDGARAKAALEKLLETESTNIALVEAIDGVAQHRATP